jgi:hypothetical protein
MNIIILGAGLARRIGGFIEHARAELRLSLNA